MAVIKEDDLGCGIMGIGIVMILAGIFTALGGGSFKDLLGTAGIGLGIIFFGRYLHNLYNK